MKVKVNGAWVDVPAFKVTEKVGDVACLEGDITLTSEANFCIVTHNLGVLPIYATLEVAEDFTPTTSRAVACFLSRSSVIGDINCFGVSLAQQNNETSTIPWSNGTSSTYSAWIRTDIVRFYSGASARLFQAKKYHYKIYYQI